MSDAVIELTDENFEEEVLQSELPVLVDFWAEWCGPCRAIAPLIDEVASSYSGRLKVGKLDIDKNSVSPAKYGVRSIPTLILVKEGNVQTTKVGSLSKSQIVALIDENL